MPQIRLHGLPCVAPDAGRAIALSAREAAALAWLHLEGPTPRARLAGLLWPAGTEAQARANLRQLLARLRRSAGAVITEADGVLTLAADHGVTDEAGGALLGGLEFDDLPELAQWLAARRDEATRRLQREGLARGRASLDHGDLDAALAAADALLAAQPESEEGWRLRMEALYVRGDRAAAIAAWDACKDTLRSSFGVAPSAATNELGRFILASPDAPAAPAARPGALPAALRRPPQLVGREGLLSDLARVLALGRSAVVTGPGGIGKSRVLQQVAAGMEPALCIHARPGRRRAARRPARAYWCSRRWNASTRRSTRSRAATRAPAAGRRRGVAGAGRPGRRGPAFGTGAPARHDRRVGNLSACQARGLRLLVVDDLQFADDASLAVLRFVLGHWLVQAEEGSAASAQVLLGARAQELSATGQALVAMVNGHANGHLFELAPLQAADVHELVSRLPLPEVTTRAWGPGGGEALARALHATVGGNPAFVLEALRSLYLDGFAGWTPAPRCRCRPRCWSRCDAASSACPTRHCNWRSWPRWRRATSTPRWRRRPSRARRWRWHRCLPHWSRHRSSTAPVSATTSWPRPCAARCPRPWWRRCTAWWRITWASTAAPRRAWRTTWSPPENCVLPRPG